MTTIREYIGNDLASRLSSGAGPPSELSLTALSRHYGVSPTPVREAIRDLLAAGVLQKQENGRLRVGEAKARREESPPPPVDASILEDRLSAELIGRSLRGETDYLREEATAARYNVGRTAIRQAFGRLAGRGLIVHVPRCGWKVRAFDEADLSAFLEVRETLEKTALDLAWPHLKDDDLRRMLDGNCDDARAPRIDNDFHAYLVRKSGNRYILDFFDRHGPYYACLFDYATPEAHEVVEMARQHRDILRALLERDWPRASRVLVEHIRAQKSIVSKLLGRMGRPDPPTPSP